MPIANRDKATNLFEIQLEVLTKPLSRLPSQLIPHLHCGAAHQKPPPLLHRHETLELQTAQAANKHNQWF